MSSTENGTSIRRGTAEDASACAHVHVAAWRTTYEGLLPNEAVISLNFEQRTRSFSIRQELKDYAIFLAETKPDGVIGFADVGPPRAPHWPADAELYAIYLLATHQRRGVGRKLLATIAAHLLATGRASMYLRVLSGNPAERFYQSLGGKRIGEEPVERAGEKFRHIIYGWDTPALTRLAQAAR